MKILLFGRDGQVGWELQRSLAPLGDLVALGFDSTDLCGNFTNLVGLAETVRAVRPDVVINAAAYTAVDKAEAEPKLAQTINALAPEVLAREVQALGAWLVHYSTDYVFDGSGDRPWQESDVPAPINVYGETKFEGEQRIRKIVQRHLILRTSWVYAARGNNFAKTMLRLAGERDCLTVINDQLGAPTGADLLADVTSHALRHLFIHPEHAGLYHVAAAGQTSWHGYACSVLDAAQAVGVRLKTLADAVQPVSSSAFVAAARRPLNSRLNCARFQSTFDLKLPAWQSGVQRMLNEILPSSSN